MRVVVVLGLSDAGQVPEQVAEVLKHIEAIGLLAYLAMES